MIGGEAAAVERLRPLFVTLAPAGDRGWARVGPSGAGHFTKMIHNGIEYGLMQAYAEGFSILAAQNRSRARPRIKSRKPGGTAASCARGCST